MAEPDMVREGVVAELLLGESTLSGSRPPNISLFSLTRAACSRTPSSCESISAKWKSVDCRQISANSTTEADEGDWSREVSSADQSTVLDSRSLLPVSELTLSSTSRTRAERLLE